MQRTQILGLLVCLLSLPTCYAQAADAEKSEKSESAKPQIVVAITIKGTCPEGQTPMGLFGEMRQSLPTVIRRIDQAAEDDEVAALWLRLEPLSVGRGKLHELREAIARFRKAGKPAYAELTSADGSQYLLAAACNEIVMPPSGTLIITGVRAEVTFYKGLLDKLGIQFDALQFGKYKGAVEPFTRSELSEPLRESLEALVDDTYEGMVATIATDRSMKDYKVKTLLDDGLFTASAALRAGLIDRVAYADQFREKLKKQLKLDEMELVTNYGKKQLDTDFSGMAGMMKLMQMLMGQKPSKPKSKLKKIALVYAVGPILEGKSITDLFGDTAVGSTTMVAALRKADEDPQVVAIVLRIDSPGGSATASDLIWRETVRIKKPIIASMGDVAGSGGYYIAMGADKILAAPGTVTGSIGVVGGKIVLGGLYEKLGLTTEVISRGKNSGSISSSQPFTPEERKVWLALIKEIYRQFVSKAAQGRKVSYAELDKLAQGRVYTGRMAAANGLIDGLGTLRDAIAEAKQAAGLKPDEKVELILLPRPKTIFEQLLGDPSVSTSLGEIQPELLETMRQTTLLRRLFVEPALMWMPYALRLR